MSSELQEAIRCVEERKAELKLAISDHERATRAAADMARQLRDAQGEADDYSAGECYRRDSLERAEKYLVDIVMEQEEEK